MATENRCARCMAVCAQPLLGCGAIFHWDGVGPLSQCWESIHSAEPGSPNRSIALSWTPAAVRAQGPTTPKQTTPPPIVVGPMCLLPSVHLQAIDWETEAAHLTCALEPGLLMAATHDMIPRVTSELVWFPQEGHATSLPCMMRPVLLVQTASASPQVARVMLVLHLRAGDPLLHHIALMLRTASAADSTAGRLYTEALAEALATHLLRRYAVCKHTVREIPTGLTPSKLRHTKAYIQAHLEQALFLTELAAVAQTSPDHFARLFKQATGQTPHQYMVLCRIECAKRLLTETTLPLTEIGLQVGCTDQSYFTALFRRHVGTTPKAYRATTAR